MNCDVGEPTEDLQISFSNLYRPFTYVTTHSPTLPSLYLRHSSFCKPSVASPTSQFILQPIFRFSYVTSFSLNSLGSRRWLQSVWKQTKALLEYPVYYRATPAMPSEETSAGNAGKIVVFVLLYLFLACPYGV